MSIGEKWDTDFAVFEKRNVEVLVCVSSVKNKERELQKTETICKYLNIKYLDERET